MQHEPIIGRDFCRVNRPGMVDYSPGHQKHHIIPLAVQRYDNFVALFRACRTSLNNFAQNGVLLPCVEDKALETGLPLHRGPHPRYSELVMDRLSSIESHFARYRDHKTAVQRIAWLQKGLRYGLTAGQLRKRRSSIGFLNTRDPFRAQTNFTQLDSAVDILWAATDAG